MRTQKAALNVLSALILQLTTLVCGFILPRAILNAFGSDTNGLISSATQFLGYITLLEAGVGGVTRAALYKPLAEKDDAKLSGILCATERFFRKIALIFVVYVVILSVVFPHIATSDKSDVFIIGIVLVISISTFVQYYFGITYSIFLQADQKNYISNLVHILTLLLNTILSLILINLGFGIHVVKLGTAFVYVLRPLVLNCYVRRKYNLNLKCEPDNNAIRDRWSGLGQHIAFFLHSNTDVVVLTLFMNIKEVSVYSIYSMVTVGVKNLTSVVSNGLEAGFGNLIAKNEQEILNRTFRIYETLISIVAITLFMTAASLIIPFIRIYTDGINDVNYIRPSVAFLMIASEMIYCFRLPYNSVTLAAGHYKQTQTAAYWEAGINIVLSLVLVKPFGINGIIFATILAMTVRLFHFAYYLSANILHRSFAEFVKRMVVNIIIIIFIAIIDKIIPFILVTDYYSFFIDGFLMVAINSIVVFLFNLFVYPQETKNLIGKFFSLLHK